MEIARTYELAESQARKIEKDWVRPNEHKSVNELGVYPNSGNRLKHNYSSKSPDTGNQRGKVGNGKQNWPSEVY